MPPLRPAGKGSPRPSQRAGVASGANRALRFDAKRRYSEREVNEVLSAHHHFGDHCLLRRELIEMKLLTRTPGGAEYRKVHTRPDAEVVALLGALRQCAA